MILVVGSDGLLGGALLATLRSRGLNAMGTSRRASSEKIHLNLLQPLDFVIPGNTQTAFLCAGATGVVDCHEHPTETAQANVTGTLVLANRLKERGANIVFLSSSLVFGGDKPMAAPHWEVDPCCEYGAQKAAVERALGQKAAVIRLTKIIESLRPRFQQWASELARSGKASASERLRFAPLPLQAVVEKVADFSRSFAPGIFHMSPPDDISYVSAARVFGSLLGCGSGAVRADHGPAPGCFWRVPEHATLSCEGPSASSCWHFPPAQVTLDGFLQQLHHER